MTTRRLFLAGAASLIAAPAIVRAESLMKIVMPKPKVILSLKLTAADIARINGQRLVAMDRIIHPPMVWSESNREMMRLTPIDPEPYHVALSYLNEVLARGYWKV